MRKIVFVGNCQIESVYNLYVKFAANAGAEALYYIRSYESLSQFDLESIERADVVVEQIQDFKSKANVAGIQTSAERIGVPVVHCGFLWPFAGQPHPANPTPSFLASGPYGTEMSDAYLNRLFKQRIPVEEAISQYAALDINQTVNLDRLEEIVLEKQQDRDKLTGYSIAPLMSEFFRTEQIFLTPYHPNLRIAMSLASQTFAKLGVSTSDTALMLRAVRKTPFPKEELPIHPAVAQHFGLVWASPDRRYRLLSEGSFTFAQFARRYLQCEWNPEMEEGMTLARQKNWVAAQSLLERGFERSPESAAGYATLGHVLEQLGDRQEALSVTRKAVSLDPDVPSYHLQLGLLLEQGKDLAAAEAEFHQAAKLEPYDAHYPGMLAHFMIRQRRYGDALEAARYGISHLPRAGNLHAIAGYALGMMGDLPGADGAYREAARLMPANPAPLAALAEIYETSNQLDEAIDVLRSLIAMQPSEPQALGRLGVLLERVGRFNEAATVWLSLGEAKPTDVAGHTRAVAGLMHAGRFDDAIKLAQDGLRRFRPSSELLMQLATGLERSGRIQEAITCLQDNDPIVWNDAALLSLLGDLFVRVEAFTEAEQVLRRLIVVSPGSAHAFGQLGNVLSRLGQHAAAITARKVACSIEPENWHRHAQVGHVFMAAGQLDQAETWIRRAIAGLPDQASFYLDLGNLLSVAGRDADAIQATKRALELGADSESAYGHLAFMLEKTGAYGEAETAYRAAIEAQPRKVHWHIQLCRLLDRQGHQGAALSAAQLAMSVDPANRWLRDFVEARAPVDSLTA